VDHALDLETLLEDDANHPPEVLHSFTPSGFPVARLVLRIGCPIMILRNLQPREGVCNGYRGIVTKISTRILEVRLFSGTTVLVPRIKLISADPDILFKLQRLQLPVSLSFAMTINKSQGQTFEVVGIDLRHPVFSHGQLYVALSRARHLSSLRCITSESDKTQKTKNVVFREVVI
jgi:ATP-dependent exoDNAse (exonuclease V) alpha subunit